MAIVEACCEIDARLLTDGSVAPGACPGCGERGKKVETITLQSLVEEDLRTLEEVSYFFCRTAHCQVVYFSQDGTQAFTQEQVRVPVFQKESDPSVHVCYCFNFAVRDIQDEVARTGTSTVPDQITQGVQEGKCACEITNPQGSCCLGNVRLVVEEAQDALKAVPVWPQGPAGELIPLEGQEKTRR